MDLTLDDLGSVTVKNIERPVRAFKIVQDTKAAAALLAASKRDQRSQKQCPRSWFIVAATGLLLIIGSFTWWQMSVPEFEPVDPSDMVQSLPDKPSMAVLALDDLSTGEDKGYLSDAIAEGIITELSRFSEFLVIARNSSFKYRGEATDVRTIAKELGVHYILEGSQQKSGANLRVTVQLIDALAGSHIWAETYDRELADLFAVQDEIVRKIVAAVGGNVAFRSPPSGGLSTVSALHFHLQSRPFVREWTREGTLKGLELNLAAVEADPKAAYGYIGLAFLYPRAEFGWLDMDAAEGFAKAEEAADKALAIDPSNYDAHYARGFVHQQKGEHDQAINRYSHALELNPNAANVMAGLSNPLMYTGRVEEALNYMEQAVRLDPHHPNWFKWNLAWAQWATGNCQSALSTMRAMTNMPNRARRMLAIIQICLGQQKQAEETIAEFIKKAPDYSIRTVLRESEKLYTERNLLNRYIDGLRKAGLPE